MVWDQDLDPNGESSSTVRAHYLSFPVHAKLVGRLGSFSGYLLAGPIVEQLLRTQCEQVFCQTIVDERPTALSIGGGSGIGINVGERLRTEVEVRVVQGLTEAYRSNQGGTRHRSMEIIVRACFPF
jgi:hypothetical protein